MAILRREEYRINTVKLNTGIPLGVSIPFNDPGVFKMNYTTKEQVKSNLINLLLTSRGERVFNPEFGGDIRSMLFEQDVNNDVVTEFLISKVQRYIPLITELSVKLQKDNMAHTLYITVDYSINNEQDSTTIQIDNNQ